MDETGSRAVLPPATPDEGTAAASSRPPSIGYVSSESSGSVPPSSSTISSRSGDTWCGAQVQSSSQSQSHCRADSIPGSVSISIEKRGNPCRSDRKIESKTETRSFGSREHHPSEILCASQRRPGVPAQNNPSEPVSVRRLEEKVVSLMDRIWVLEAEREGTQAAQTMDGKGTLLPPASALASLRDTEPPHLTEITSRCAAVPASVEAVRELRIQNETLRAELAVSETVRGSMRDALVTLRAKDKISRELIEELTNELALHSAGEDGEDDDYGEAGCGGATEEEQGPSGEEPLGPLVRSENTTTTNVAATEPPSGGVCGTQYHTAAYVRRLESSVETASQLVADLSNELKLTLEREAALEERLRRLLQQQQEVARETTATPTSGETSSATAVSRTRGNVSSIKNKDQGIRLVVGDDCLANKLENSNDGNALVSAAGRKGHLFSSKIRREEHQGEDALLGNRRSKAVLPKEQAHATMKPYRPKSGSPACANRNLESVFWNRTTQRQQQWQLQRQQPIEQRQPVSDSDSDDEYSGVDFDEFELLWNEDHDDAICEHKPSESKVRRSPTGRPSEAIHTRGQGTGSRSAFDAYGRGPTAKHRVPPGQRSLPTRCEQRDDQSSGSVPRAGSFRSFVGPERVTV